MPKKKLEQMQMVDFHTHILPRADDGAKCFEESLEMLQRLYFQGIKTVVCTPHFYPDSMERPSFFERREKSLSKLLSELKKSGEERPHIAIGAEVFYYPTIYNFDELERFCIEGTKYLLLEMPFARWGKDELGVVKKIIDQREIIPIIAHIDRYFKFGNGAREAEILKGYGAVIQVNCEALYPFFVRKKVLSMIKSSLVDVFGTDCHNLTTRPPEIKPAFDAIVKKIGPESLINLEKKSKNILQDAVLY